MSTSHQTRGYADGGSTIPNTYNGRDLALPIQSSHPRSPSNSQHDFQGNGSAFYENNSHEPIQSAGLSPRPPPQQQQDIIGNGETRDLAHRDRPKMQSSATSKREQRICAACGESLTGQFVRALNGTYHLECFRCRVCYIVYHKLSVVN